MNNKALSQSEQDSLLIFVKRLGYGYVENSVTFGGIACWINGEYVIYNPFRDAGQAFSLLVDVVVDDPFAEAQISFGDNQFCLDLSYNTVVGSTDYEPQQKRWAICQLICEAVLKHLLKDINVA